MNIYKISRAGKVLGEYDESTVRRYLDAGSIKLHDFGWTDGMTEWLPLHELGFRVSLPTSTTPNAQSYAHMPHQTQESCQVTEEKVQLFGYAGAVLLAIGTFGPFMNVAMFSVTILQNWNWKGVTVLFCAIASAIITFSRIYAANWITAAIPCLIFAYIFIDMNETTGGKDFGSKLARSMVSPGWGLCAMGLGIAALCVCAGMSSKPMKKLS